jgi:hypothetical protein
MISSAISRKPLLRAAFGLVWFLLNASAFAQWNLLGRTENLRVYLDQGSISRQGNVAQMWQLYDYTSAQWVGTQQVVLSFKNLVEYDCTSLRARIIAGAAYTEQMGAGKLVISESTPDAEWNVLPPGGTGENTWKIACGKN